MKKVQPQDHKPAAGKQNGVGTIQLNGPLAGHWVEFRVEMTGREAIAVFRADQDMGSALTVVGSRTLRHSFGGDILDQPLSTVAAVLSAMNRYREDAVVDPPPASASDGS